MNAENVLFQASTQSVGQIVFVVLPFNFLSCLFFSRATYDQVLLITTYDQVLPLQFQHVELFNSDYFKRNLTGQRTTKVVWLRSESLLLSILYNMQMLVQVQKTFCLVKCLFYQNTGNLWSYMSLNVHAQLTVGIDTTCIMKCFPSPSFKGSMPLITFCLGPFYYQGLNPKKR